VNSHKRVIATILATVILLMLLIVFPHAETVDLSASSSVGKETSQVSVQSNIQENSSAGQTSLPVSNSPSGSTAANSQDVSSSQTSVERKSSSSAQVSSGRNQSDSSQTTSGSVSSVKETPSKNSTIRQPEALRSAARTDAAISPQTIADRLGIAANFGIFARKFTLNCDMEGNIAVETFAATAGNIGNSANIYTNGPGTFDLKIFINGIAKKTYQVGIYSDAAAKNLFQMVSLTADAQGKAVKTVSGLDSRTVYYVYLLDSSGNPISGSGTSQQGITGGGDILYSCNDSYIQTLTDPSGGPKLPIGWEIFRRIQFGSTVIPQSVTFGTKYLLYNRNAGNIVYRTTGDGTDTLYDPNKRQNVITTIGGGTDNAVFIKDTFPFDFDEVFANLSGLSKTLAGTQDCNNETVRIINVAPSGSDNNALRDALLKAFHSNDINYLSNNGIGLNSGQYLVVNVNCGANTSVTIPSCRIGNTTIDTDGGWNDISSRILWNFYGGSSSLTVNAPFGALGTILAPSATVKYGSTMNGAIYAYTVYNDTGEIHKMSFRPAQKVTREVSFTDRNAPPFTLPETGGPGTGIFYVAGGGILFISVVIFVYLLNVKQRHKTKMRVSSPK
jgi:hypothetical protein